MTQQEIKTVEAKMNQQFWSFDEIVEVATAKREEPIANYEPDNHEERKFKATVAGDVLKAIRDGRITRIKANKKGRVFDPDNPNHEMLANLARGAFPLAMLAYFYLLTEKTPPNFLTEGVSPINTAFFTVALPLGVLFLMPPLTSVWFYIQNRLARTPEDRLKYTMELAGFYGVRDDLYDSDSAICFLNQTFKSDIPRTPFRVWPDPFFRRNGDIWIVGFGGTQVLLRSDKKTQDRNERIAYLLQAPFKDFPCEQLVSKGLPETDMPSREMEDDGEHTHIKRTIEEKGLTLVQIETAAKALQSDAENARAAGELELLEELESQHQYLCKYLKENKNRKPDRNAGEQARDSLKKNKAALVKDVFERNPELGDHLRKYINFSGSTVSYRPPDDLRWDVEF